MGVIVATEVKYVPGGNNKVLRHVLRTVWDTQCYWCNKIKKYTELEIDHIVAQSSTAEELEHLKREINLPNEYDVNALPNLAPICSACNKEKGKHDFTGTPLVLSKLNKAKKLAPTVAKRVKSFKRSKELGAALLLAADANLDNEDERASFFEGASAVVQKIADATGTVEYFTVRQANVDVQDQTVSIDVRLDEVGRATVRIIEEVVGVDLDDALIESLSELFNRVEKAIEGAFENHDEGMGAPAVGGVLIDWPTVVVTKASYEAAQGAEFFFVLEGTFEGVASASVSRSDLYDGDLEDVQGDASFDCRFTISQSWDPTMPQGQMSLDQVWLDDIDVETALDGRPSAWWDNK